MKKLLLFLLCCGAVAATAQISGPRAARFQTVLDSVCAKLKVKGTQAAVYLPAGGLWQGAYGISEPGVPIDTTMQLGLGSNTKTYVAALLLKLQESAMLSLDDTIGQWFPTQPHITGSATVRQLLNHTSGLGDYTGNAQFWDSINTDYARLWTPEEMLSFIPPATGAPGASWAYCNTNFLLAGLIAEQVTGLQLSDALRTYLLQPNGLDKTFLWGEESPTAVVPHVWYALTPGDPQEDLDLWGYSHNAFLSAAHGAGALLSTAGDNARFWHRLQSGKMLSASSMEEFTDCVSLGGGAGYGLGVFRYGGVFGGRTVLSHGGTGLGFINENAVDTATGICVTVLTNQDSIGNDPLLLKVVGALMRDALADPTALEENAISAEGVMIYPVPAQEQIYVRTEAVLSRLELMDATGRPVLMQTADALQSRISVHQLPAGLYILRGVAAGERTAFTQKVQVIH